MIFKKHSLLDIKKRLNLENLLSFYIYKDLKLNKFFTIKNIKFKSYF